MQWFTWALTQRATHYGQLVMTLVPPFSCRSLNLPQASPFNYLLSLIWCVWTDYWANRESLVISCILSMLYGPARPSTQRLTLETFALLCPTLALLWCAETSPRNFSTHCHPTCRLPLTVEENELIQIWDRPFSSHNESNLSKSTMHIYDISMESSHKGTGHTGGENAPFFV